MGYFHLKNVLSILVLADLTRWSGDAQNTDPRDGGSNEGLDPLELESSSLWPRRDPFDEIQSKINSVNEDNCAIKHVGDLKLPADSVSHLPDIKEININPVFPNRTALLHLHNMALSRSFFFSYILQSRSGRMFGSKKITIFLSI